MCSGQFGAKIKQLRHSDDAVITLSHCELRFVGARQSTGRGNRFVYRSARPAVDCHGARMASHAVRQCRERLTTTTGEGAAAGREARQSTGRGNRFVYRSARLAADCHGARTASLAVRQSRERLATTSGEGAPARSCVPAKLSASRNRHLEIEPLDPCVRRDDVPRKPRSGDLM